MTASRSRLIGRKLTDVEGELRARYGSWTTLHEGLPGNIDRDPDRINVWVDDELWITRITRG